MMSNRIISKATNTKSPTKSEGRFGFSKQGDLFHEWVYCKENMWGQKCPDICITQVVTTPSHLPLTPPPYTAPPLVARTPREGIYGGDTYGVSHNIQKGEKKTQTWGGGGIYTYMGMVLAKIDVV